jgi:hypothetical protein
MTKLRFVLIVTEIEYTFWCSYLCNPERVLHRGLTTSRDASELLTDIAALKMLPTISNEQHSLAGTGFSQRYEKHRCSKHQHILLLLTRESSVGIPTGDRLDNRGSIPGSEKIYFFPNASRSALRPTKSPIQWLPGAVS